MSETRSFRFLFVAVIAFFYSGYLSCVEFKYMLWGQSTDAKFIRVTKGIDLDRKNDPDRKILGVRFQFNEEDGTPRENVINREIDWQEPADGTIKIDYLPGKERASRVHGERKTFPMVVFFTAMGLLTFSFVRLYRKAYES